MGQKVHPESHARGLHPRLEVQLVHRARLQRLPRSRTSAIRSHIIGKLAHAGLSRHHDPQGRQRGGGQHPHRAPGHRDRQVRLRGRRPAQGPAPDDAQADQGQHPRDQAPRARREARRAVDRRAAAEPRRLPPRDEARPDERDALRAPRAARSRSPAASAAPRWRAPRATPTAASRCTRCAPTSTTASTRPRTTFGRIGVKCWINKGEIMPEGYTGADLTEMDGPPSSGRTTAAARRP